MSYLVIALLILIIVYLVKRLIFLQRKYNYDVSELNQEYNDVMSAYIEQKKSDWQ